MSEVSRISDELSREHDGDPWHGPALLHILEGISASHAAAHPIGVAHSIWEIVLPVTAWQKEVRRRLSGAEAGLPQEGDWPPVGEATEQRWREARVRLQEAHAGLTRALRDFPEKKLLEPTNDKRDRSIGSGVSYYTLLARHRPARRLSRRADRDPEERPVGPVSIHHPWPVDARRDR